MAGFHLKRENSSMFRQPLKYSKLIAQELRSDFEAVKIFAISFHVIIRHQVVFHSPFCVRFNAAVNCLITGWFKYYRDDLCVNNSQFVPVIFEPPCI
jgi:hypothetical protein